MGAGLIDYDQMHNDQLGVIMSQRSEDQEDGQQDVAPESTNYND